MSCSRTKKLYTCCAARFIHRHAPRPHCNTNHS